MVLGACCSFGRSMVRALVASGAQVVAVDANADGLKQLAGAVPLTLKGTPEEGLRRVGRAWGEARLDAVLNLMPLRPDQALDVGAGAMGPALVSAQSAFAHALRRDGLTLNIVNVGEGAVKPAHKAVVGLLAKSLGAITGSELRL